MRANAKGLIFSSGIFAAVDDDLMMHDVAIVRNERLMNGVGMPDSMPGRMDTRIRHARA